MLDLRLIHIAFFVTWFLFIAMIEIAQPQPGTGSISRILPAALGLVGISEIGIGFFLRSKFLAEAEAILREDGQNRAAMLKWRTGNLLSFCFAEAISLFGVVLKFLGYEWRIAGVFFGVGLLLLILWTPQKIEALPQGVR